MSRGLVPVTVRQVQCSVTGTIREMETATTLTTPAPSSKIQPQSEEGWAHADPNHEDSEDDDSDDSTTTNPYTSVSYTNNNMQDTKLENISSLNQDKIDASHETQNPKMDAYHERQGQKIDAVTKAIPKIRSNDQGGEKS
ncbi:MAG: hypothetical protein LQ350_001062 [Teloschistes chrysophthalmus]|nr:MAG: hypothetical protein LQ350_001062 [Niorma chrysophthalma]